jgi:hypothetical protein
MDWFNVNYDTVQIFDCVNAVMNLRVLKYRGMHTLFMLSVVIQPFVGPWPLFSFLNLHTVCRIPWTGGQPIARRLPTHRITQTQN